MRKLIAILIYALLCQTSMGKDPAVLAWKIELDLLNKGAYVTCYTEFEEDAFNLIIRFDHWAADSIDVLPIEFLRMCIEDVGKVAPDSTTQIRWLFIKYAKENWRIRTFDCRKFLSIEPDLDKQDKYLMQKLEKI